MKERICRICNASNQDKEFVMRNQAKNIQANICKDCAKIKSKTHYRANKAQYMKRNNINRDANRKLIYQYLLEHPCIDCGETDPVVLEFDHRDPKQKKFRIASIATHSSDNLIKEMNKCDIRCANCHRRKTAKQLNHYRHQFRI